MTILSVRRVSLLVVCALACARTATAQESVPRFEAGGQAAVTSLTFGPHSPGFGGWFDVNLSRRLAVEARAIAFSAIGRTPVQLSAGVRATLIQHRRASLYGFVLPGMYRDPKAPTWTVLSVTPAGTDVVLTALECCTPGLRTHFVLDMGAGLALFPSSRLVTRIEVDRDLHAEPGSPVERLPTYIGGRWNLHVGASYRLGSRLAPATSSTQARGWTMGPQVGVTVATNESAMGTAGVFASHRLNRICDFDAGVGGFLSNGFAPSFYEGGRMVQALAGIKLGVREGSFGVFFKFRSGVNSYSKAAKFDPLPRLARLTVPVIDLGGVIEASLSRHTTLRIDIGETLAFSPGGSIPPLPGFEDRDPHYTYPAEQIYGLPIRFGLGWRF